MEIADDDEGPEEAATNVGDNVEENIDLAKISLHAILGKTSSTMMKLRGTISDKHIIILVDNGSTHNFIMTDIVEELKLLVQIISPFEFQISNIDIICSVVIWFAGSSSSANPIWQLYPFTIGGDNVVLEIKWLVSLNMVQANWTEMFMIFHLDGK